MDDKNGQMCRDVLRSYGLRLAVGNGRRLYLPLGHERAGWTRELANTTLLVVAVARRAEATTRGGRRRRG